MKKKKKRSIREIPFGISKQININFRNYALYVLENRGIPNFYDGLTNVQRVILMNAPKTFNKTISLVGSCISDGYHHGDSSLSKAINKMAKPFGCSEEMLYGDGFFGTPINPEASAARYTFVKINPTISQIMSKHMALNSKTKDEQWSWLHTEIPIGLLGTIIGLGVGYKSQILPRKLDEINKFLEGKTANLNPYFKDFPGKISPYNNLKKSWIIEGVKEISENKKSIRITCLPPLMKYERFIKRLSTYLDADMDFEIQNDSTDDIDITLKYKSGETWNDFKEKIEQMTKLIVTETITFVRDGSLIEYADIIDYLNEFRVHKEFVKLSKSIYDLEQYNHELEYLKAKLEYLKFMLVKKRSDEEIEKFLSKFENKIKNRLDRTMLKELSNETVSKTKKAIADMKSIIEKENTLKNKIEKTFEKLKKDTPIYSKRTKTKRAVDLFIEDDSDEIDGIEVFKEELEYVEDED